jgi:PleD family two-component response regulator
MAKIAKIKRPASEHTEGECYRVLALGTPMHVDQLEEACLKAGHEVVAMTTIEDAMTFLETKNHVDIVICETHLLNESVFEFLKQVKADSMHANVRFMMLCTNASELAKFTSLSTEHAAILLGCDKYLLMQNLDIDRLAGEINLLMPKALPKNALKTD